MKSQQNSQMETRRLENEVYNINGIIAMVVGLVSIQNSKYRFNVT